MFTVVGVGGGLGWGYNSQQLCRGGGGVISASCYFYNSHNSYCLLLPGFGGVGGGGVWDEGGVCGVCGVGVWGCVSKGCGFGVRAGSMGCGGGWRGSRSPSALPPPLPPPSALFSLLPTKVRAFSLSLPC